MRRIVIACAMAIGAGAHAQRPPAPPAATAQAPAQAAAASRSTMVMERFEGTPMSTDLGFGIVLNKASKLKREWYVMRDEAAPAILEPDTGIMVFYKSGDRSTSSHYQYRMDYKVTAREPLTAFELRAIVVDVFGRHIKTLSAVEVQDFSGSKTFDAIWRVFSENEASEAFASIAYIANARTASGRVYEADRNAVLEQVRRATLRLTAADLELKRESTPR